MEVNIKSAALYSYLAPLLGQNSDLASQRINVVVLLRNAKMLQTHLNDLKERMHIDQPQGPLMSLLSEQNAQIEAELTLLLEGLITDHQVFRSFGYDILLERGYVSYDLWKASQRAKSSLLIGRLDNAFQMLRSHEDDFHLDQRARHDFQHELAPALLSQPGFYPRDLSEAAQFGDVARVKELLADGCDPNALVLDPFPYARIERMPLVEAIKHWNPEIFDLLISHGANVDGPNDAPALSPLRAALKGKNTYAISKLLSHMADLKVLGQLQDADCLQSATDLIMNHGISTESILRVIPRPEVMKKRLRCALFDAGADIRILINDNHPSYETRIVRRRTASRGHLDKTRGMVTGNHPMSDTVTEVSQGLADFLGLAGSVGEGLQTGIDNYQTEALQSVKNARDMIHAIQRNDVESVDVHVKLGADPTLGLTAALLIRDPRIFKLLLERGADTDCVVPSKARASLMAAIKAGNLCFVDLLLEACRASDSLGYVNFAHNGWTPLMIAVLHNNERIVRSLIRHGARPDFDTYNGDTYTIPRQNGFHRVFQILRQGPRKEKNVLTEQWLKNNKLNAEEQRNSPVRRLNKMRLRKLHRMFRKQHFIIWACAEASVKTLRAVEPAPREFSETNTWPVWEDLSDVLYPRDWSVGPISSTMFIRSLLARPDVDARAWGPGFDADYKKAWKSGINVMRTLLAGKLPSSLNDTIMFLAIAKAMCLSALTLGLSMSQSDFASDIGRWQILFESENGNLLNFQEAVSSIWGIRLEHLSHVNSPDSETLAYFQELAVCLADDAELYFGLGEHDCGLIASQEHWQSRNKLRVPEEDQHDLVRQESRASINKIQTSRQSEESSTRRPPDNDTTQDSGTSMPIWNMFRTDPKVHTFSLIAILLIAGFIFSVVLTFLLGKKYH